MSSPLTPLRTWRPRSKTRRVSPQISSVLSSLESSSKMVALFLTITSKKSQLFTWSSDFAVVCKSSLRPSPVRPSLSMLSPLTQLITWRPKSRTRKASPQISSASSSLESNSKTAAPSVTTTSKRSQPSTWFFASAVASEDSWSPAPAPLIIILPKPCALSTFLNFLLHFHC